MPRHERGRSPWLHRECERPSLALERSLGRARPCHPSLVRRISQFDSQLPLPPYPNSHISSSMQRGAAHQKLLTDRGGDYSTRRQLRLPPRTSANVVCQLSLTWFSEPNSQRLFPIPVKFLAQADIEIEYRDQFCLMKVEEFGTLE